nr:hypothetical protein [Tanacetum cinerariifolium]
ESKLPANGKMGMIDILIFGTLENYDRAKTMINKIVSHTQTREDKKPTDNVENSIEVKQVPAVAEVNNQVPIDAGREVSPSMSYIGGGDRCYVNARNAGYYTGGAGAYSVGAYGEYYLSGY